MVTPAYPPSAWPIHESIERLEPYAPAMENAGRRFMTGAAGYGPAMNETSPDAGRPEPNSPEGEQRERDAGRAAHDALSAIDAEHVVDDPGDAEAEEPESPASDTAAPPPG